MNVYERKGFNNRKEYLEHLAEEYGIDHGMVFAAAATLGPNEDFDGLVTMLEDEAGELD